MVAPYQFVMIVGRFRDSTTKVHDKPPLSKAGWSWGCAGWSWGCVAIVDFNGRTIFIADAHRDDRKRFVVRADESLTAFVKLELTVRAVTFAEESQQEFDSFTRLDA
jgi:hypothetical protein